MYTIAKRFSFSASHQLDHLPPEHPCARLHGHNYEVEVILQQGFLEKDGFVRDYRGLDVFKQYLDETLDHQHLNTILGAGLDTTAENLARFLYNNVILLLPDWPIYSVRVSETPKTWAEYKPEVYFPPIGPRS